MQKSLFTLIILLLIQLYSLAGDIYPKKLIIQNSSKNKDTVIAYTNEQVQQINKEHLLLKYCIEYTTLQDSIIKDDKSTIISLQKLNNSLITQDSLSREFIISQTLLIEEKDLQKKQVEESFKKYVKQTKKNNLKTWLFSNLIVTPILIGGTVALTKFLIK